MRSALILAVVLTLTGCAATEPGDGSPESIGPVFPAGAIVDYQLGTPYPPPEGVTVVERDNEAEPEPGMYSICYVNAFQTQPDAQWPEDLLVHESDGGLLVDPNWPREHIFDLSTAEQRERIAEGQHEAIDNCADKGFDAVEFDNLDSYTRSDDSFTLEESVAYARLIIDYAHAAGLPVGQKNTAELGERGRDELGFDFLIAEDCDAWEECSDYTEVWGDRVIDIEYTDAVRRPFAEVCADPQTPASTILRDRGLGAPDEDGYHFEHC